MLLSDRDITAAIDSGDIHINPYVKSLLQPASLDVCLGSEFLHVGGDDFHPRRENVGPFGAFTLWPQQFVLASTYETVTISKRLAARLEGKSSLGRLGLLTHATAGFIDPGFSGTITLELYNVSDTPLTLRPGMRIGQLCFMEMASPASAPYGAAKWGSHYQHQDGPTESVLEENIDDGSYYRTLARAAA